MRHPAGIAALGVMNLYFVRIAIVEIDMVHSYGCRSDYLDRSTFQESGITTGAGAYDQCVCIHQIGPCDFFSGHIGHFTIWFEHTLQKRYVLVCNYLHLSTMFLTKTPSTGFIQNCLSAARARFISFFIMSNWKYN